jgi:hypothetical protein
MHTELNQQQTFSLLKILHARRIEIATGTCLLIPFDKRIIFSIKSIGGRKRREVY